MSKKYSKGFTLAEVLITLSVIGIITAVIIPVAIHSKPDENIMKFKKAHNTLYQVVSALVGSGKYYLDGDMTRDIKGNLQYSSNYDPTCKYCSYFCTFWK